MEKICLLNGLRCEHKFDSFSTDCMSKNCYVYNLYQEHCKEDQKIKLFNKLETPKSEIKIKFNWKRWNPEERSSDMNSNLSFIKFHMSDFIYIIAVKDLHILKKTTDDIEWISDIPTKIINTFYYVGYEE